MENRDIKEPKSLDEFVESLDGVSKIGDMQNRIKDKRKEILEKADKDITAYAYEMYKSYKSQNLKPFVSWKDKDNADKLDDKDKEELMIFTSEASARKAANLLYKKAPEIAESMSKNSLEYILKMGDKEGNSIIEGYISDKNDKEVYGRYQNLMGLEDAREKFKNGEMNENVKKLVTSAVVAGLKEDTAKTLKDAGYDIYIQKLARGFAISTLERGNIDKSEIDNYMSNGFDKLVDESKKAYESAVEKHGKDIYKITREAIVKGAEEKSSEKFNMITGMVYDSIKKAA